MPVHKVATIIDNELSSTANRHLNIVLLYDFLVVCTTAVQPVTTPTRFLKSSTHRRL